MKKVKANKIAAKKFILFDNQLLYVVRISPKSSAEEVRLVVLACTYPTHKLSKRVGPKTLAKASVIGYGDIGILEIPGEQDLIVPRYEAVDYVLATSKPYPPVVYNQVELASWFYKIDDSLHSKLPASVFRAYVNEQLSEEEYAVVRLRYKRTLVNGW